MSYILLILGFIILIKGADLFVSGSASISKYLKIPPIIIGLTIVAFGTSSPEAAVSISASLSNSDGISLGNIIGSNLLNISLIVGITALISPMRVEKSTIVKEIPLSILSAFVLLFLTQDIIIDGAENNILSRTDGLILIAFFSIFIYYIVSVIMKNHNPDIALFKIEEQKNSLEINIKKEIIRTIIGLAGVILGGWLVVYNAQEIAIQLGMSETLVGLTIVAIGTSLPELITSITAAIKKESEIALGNIIGSNIFNTFFVLGVSSIISPLSIQGNLLFDLLIITIISIALLVFATTHRRTINRIEGIILSSIYIVYLVFAIIRN